MDEMNVLGLEVASKRRALYEEVLRSAGVELQEGESARIALGAIRLVLSSADVVDLEPADLVVLCALICEADPQLVATLSQAKLGRILEKHYKNVEKQIAKLKSQVRLKVIPGRPQGYDLGTAIEEIARLKRLKRPRSR